MTFIQDDDTITTDSDLICLYTFASGGLGLMITPYLPNAKILKRPYKRPTVRLKPASPVLDQANVPTIRKLFTVPTVTLFLMQILTSGPVP